MMRYFKLTTSDAEVRWINLEQVSRVTLARDAASGKPVLAIFFASAMQDTKLTIVGSDDVNNKAIESFVAALDEVSANE